MFAYLFWGEAIFITVGNRLNPYIFFFFSQLEWKGVIFSFKILLSIKITHFQRLDYHRWTTGEKVASTDGRWCGLIRCFSALRHWSGHWRPGGHRYDRLVIHILSYFRFSNTSYFRIFRILCNFPVTKSSGLLWFLFSCSPSCPWPFFMAPCSR